jgi:hypothetical protein
MIFKKEDKHKDPYESIRNNKFLMEQYERLENENTTLRNHFMHEWKCPFHQSRVMKLIKVVYECPYCHGTFTTNADYDWEKVSGEHMERMPK